MSEREGQRQEESPLESERGTTTIEDIVVRRIAGRAANEVAGIHMGGNTSRTAGGVLGRATGSSGDETRGVSAEVGRVETALDLTMAIDYGRDILQVVGRVREKVEERIKSLTGLKVTELNVTVSDVVFPDDQDRGGARGRQREELPAGGSEDDTAPVREEAAPVRPREPTSRERTGREDVHVEGTPVDEGETAELRLGEEVRKRPSGERGEGSGESSGEGSREGSGRRGGRRRDRRGRGGRGDRGDGGGEGRRDR